MAIFSINPFGYFGGGYIFGAPSADSYGYGQAFDVYSGVMRAAGSIYYGGIGSMPSLWNGDFGRYQDMLFRRLGIGQGDKAPEQEQPKEVPAGTDSRDYSQRAGAYFRNRGNLPSQSDVMHNLWLNQKPSDDLRKEERVKDKVLRDSVGIVREWMKDPKACGEAYRKLQNANDHVGKAKAIFDPYGDGRYLKEFGEVVKGLQNAQDQEGADKNWKLVADWLAREVGSGVIDKLIAEISATPEMQPGNIGSETPLDDVSKEEYISKLVSDKYNYTRSEAEGIVNSFKTVEDAELAMKYMKRQNTDASKLEAAEKKMPELKKKADDAAKKGASVNVGSAKQQAMALGQAAQAEDARIKTLPVDEQAKAIGESEGLKAFEKAKRRYGQVAGIRAKAKAEEKAAKDEFDNIQKEVANANASRAKDFLNGYIEFVKERYGLKTADFMQMGYKAGELPEGVTDVATAIRWINLKLRERGIDINVPEIKTLNSNVAGGAATAGAPAMAPVAKSGGATGNKAKAPSAGQPTIEKLATTHQIDGESFEYVIKVAGQVRAYCKTATPSKESCVTVEQEAQYLVVQKIHAELEKQKDTLIVGSDTTSVEVDGITYQVSYEKGPDGSIQIVSIRK